MAVVCTQSLSLPRQPTNVPSPSPSFHDVNNDRSRQTLSLIDRCTDLRQLKQIHGQMIRTGLSDDPHSASKLFSAAALSPFSSLEYARKVFDGIPQPNLYSWNTLIRAHASTSDPLQSILVFLEMLWKSPYCPNKFTFPFLIKAAAKDFNLSVGQACHGMAIKSSFGSDLFVANSLIHCYSSCGDFDSASKVFAGIVEKDVVSWNSMMTGYAQKGFPEKALELFRRMDIENVKVTDVTMVGVLSACAKVMDLEVGRWVCSYIKKKRISVNLTLANVMLDMYSKCGSMEEAKELFDNMEEKDIITWTSMLDGYADEEDYDAARRLFDVMPRKDIAAWNALISAFEQNGKPREALAVFNELQEQKRPKPDEITLVSALSACAQLGLLDLGEWIHNYIKKQAMKLNCHLISSLIDMYAKCGDLEDALNVFNSANKRDVFVWSSMIGGLAMHGCGREAIDLFLKMQNANVKPNGVTFTNVLCACSHTGMVDDAKMFFHQMESVYRVVPEQTHYACMVDVYGRAGYLDRAISFIEAMPISPNASVWGALLGACINHGNMKLAEMASTRLLELEPKNDGAHVLLSNIYAKMGKWEHVSELRNHMRVTGLKKEPGCSSIQMDGKVHDFLVGDNTHPLSKQIYEKLDEVLERLSSVGYEPNNSQILQFVEEEEMKKQALRSHSEKLAISFGLITTGASEPIRVMKNLRVCEDCHSFAKLISDVYDRHIILRDRYRFHHFSRGKCSCLDYW